jgi:ATP-dependent DNA helicase RecG
MTVGGSGARRIELHEYPQAVIRELTVNMLAHRDYTMAGAASRVLLLSNRIEWSSPGGLPPGVTEANLLSMRNARNPGLLSILYDAGFVEGYGMGLVTVVSVLDSEGLEPPQFRDLIGGAFMVTVFGRPLTQRERGSYIELSESQRRIVRVLNTRPEVSLSDIRDALPDRSKRTIQDDITGLIDAGIVERHGQTKATRYRLRAEVPLALDGDASPH